MDIVKQLKKAALFDGTGLMMGAAEEIEYLRESKEASAQTCAIYWDEIQKLREQLGLDVPWYGSSDWWKKQQRNKMI